MGQFFPSKEKIGALSESGGTVTLADSHLKIGGQGYQTGSLDLALSGLSANTLYMLYVVLSAGVPTASVLTIDLPSGMTIDTSKLTSIVAAADPFHSSSSWASDSGTLYSGRVTYENTTSVRPRLFLDNGNFESLTSISQSSPFTVGAGDFIVLKYKVPILEWAV